VLARRAAGSGSLVRPILTMDVEKLLLARLKLEGLVHSQQWDDALRVGQHALRLVDSMTQAQLDDPIRDRHHSLPSAGGAAWHSPAGLHEIAQIGAAMVSLGIAVRSVPVGGACTELDLRELLSRVLMSCKSTPETLSVAAQALKQASGYDFNTWCQYALPESQGPPRLRLLREAVNVADATGASMLARAPHVRMSIASHLRSRSTADRALVFSIVRDMVRAAPLHLARMLSILKIAVLFEEPPLRYHAFAALMDALISLSIVPAVDPPEVNPAADHLSKVRSPDCIGSTPYVHTRRLPI